MDRKAIALVAAIGLVVAGGLVYTLAGGSSDDSDEVTAAAPAQEEAASGGESTTSGEAGKAGSGSGNNGSANKASSGGNGSSGAPGEYVDYSPELVSSTDGTKLLFFHASWCSQCNALESDIEASDIPDDVTIFKVDYDTNQDLRQEYGVTIQTTIVEVDKDGNKLDSYVAYEEPTFENVEQALLR
jgi:thiol-disulfide isomerase/thioredoxin